MGYQKPKMTNQELQMLRKLLQNEEIEFVRQGLELWEGLNLIDNRLQRLPETIGDLSQLRKLILRDNEILELPASLKKYLL